MKRPLVSLALLLLTSTFALAQASYYEHVAFDNSLADRSFYYSRASSVIPSELEAVDAKVPIETAHFVSPPNSLRLKWLSQTGGEWSIDLKVRARDGMPDFSGHSLWFWVFS